MRRLLAILIAVAVVAGCAQNKSVYVPYNDRVHKDEVYEWAPHKEGGEWWYLTGYASDQNRKLYLYHITIFHGYWLSLLELYGLHLSFTDCSTGQHVFFEDVIFGHDVAYADSLCAVYKESSICLDGRQIRVAGRSGKLNLDIEGVSNKPVTWHGRDGIIVMGHPDRPKERSFYYSFTNLKTKGEIEFLNEKGDRIIASVTGRSWFDRQWGKFEEKGWEWFSIRFFDDEEIMLFPFPKTGSREGTYINSRGNAVAFDNYSYKTTKSAVFDGRKIGTGWEVKVPFKDREYDVVALVEDQYNRSRLGDYWEGICKVLNKKGELVGYAIVETPAEAAR